MTRHRAARRLAPLVLLALAGACPPGLPAQEPSAQSVAPDPRAEQLLRLLAADPITAPYRFAVVPAGRQLILSGRVGTKVVHDVAIRTAIAGGFPVVDELVIDTTAIYRPGAAVPAVGGPPLLPTYNNSLWLTPGAMPYPPPLFGRYDDPFFGLEPPLVTYPPWYGPLSVRRLAEMRADLQAEYDALQAQIAARQAPAVVQQAPAPVPPAEVQAEPAEAMDIDVDLDPQGIAVIRGTVPSEADRDEIGRQVGRGPGVRRVVNKLEVRPPDGPDPAAEPDAGAPVAPEDLPPRPEPIRPVPPPPAPDPGFGPDPAPEPKVDPAVAPAAARAVAPASLAGRVGRAIALRPGLADLPIQVAERDGIITLSGRLPGVVEAMHAYRAAEETPGVRGVIDRLRFAVPDGQGRNPLAAEGPAEEVEPYLAAQIRRQVGGSARVDRVELRGDALEVVGSLAAAADRPRVEAILRSMPVLRGLRVEPRFAAPAP